AISSESVLSTTRSMTPDSRAARAVYSSSVRPASGRTFFPGTPFDPPRAGTRPRTNDINRFGRLATRDVLHVPYFAQQRVHRCFRGHRVDFGGPRATCVAHVEMISRVVAAQHLEARAPQVRAHRRFREVVGMIDLDRILHRPVAQVGGAEVNDVDEE